MGQKTEPDCGVCGKKKSPMKRTTFTGSESGSLGVGWVCRECEKELKPVPVE